MVSVVDLKVYLGSTRFKGTWQDDHTFVIDRLVLGLGQAAERWTLTFDGSKLNVRVNIRERLEISIDSGAGG